MNRFLIGFSVLLGLAVAAMIVILLLQPEPTPSNPLALPDGSGVRIMVGTYGTNHVVGPPLAKLAARLPPVIRNVLFDVFGGATARISTTADPRLMVWLERTTNNLTATPAISMPFCPMPVALFQAMPHV